MSELTSYMMKSSAGQILPAMAGTLTKAKTYAAEREIEESVLLAARLFPDMHPLLRQYQMAADTAARGAARLAGREVPSFPDTESNIDQLITRLEATNAFVQSVDDAAMDANAMQVLEIPLGPMTVNWEGRQYLSTFVLPNLHFHASIAFSLLRHQGVSIGKRDFLTA